MKLKCRKTTRFLALLCSSLFAVNVYAQDTGDVRRKAYLEELLEQNRSHPTPTQRPRNVAASFVRLSHQDSTWDAWQQRTGELPPNFDQLPSIPLLPNPLVWDEGRENIPVTTDEQWEKKRNWIKGQVKELLSGTFPEAPSRLDVKVLDEKMDQSVKMQLIELRFGDHEKAKLTLEVFTPPGDGPFPVFISQWNHRGWAQIAVRRGYMGVVYAGADELDDTMHYQEVYPSYDWSALMTRAWGASRAVDYLYTLPQVDKAKIALTGHSRNAKLSLLAAAFDERFTAVISSSGGTGGEIPYRYTDETHENESIDYLNSIRPQWFHPRLRFYNGREHKLPIDQNSLMALIAPNALLLSSSIREAGGGDPWAIEQNYLSVKRVYDFLEAPNKLGLRFRDGGHSVSARDLESYVDWLDIQFGRSSFPWHNTRYYTFDFEQWKKKQTAPINPLDYPVVASSSTLTGTQSVADWEKKKTGVREQLQLLLGQAPPGIKARPIENLNPRGDYMDQLISRPNPKNGKRLNIAPYNGLGDYQFGALYYPVDADGEMKLSKNGKLPVIIWSHKFSNTGFNASLTPLVTDFLDKGIGVFFMDLIGYGSRIEEGTLFYERYPNWSKMGKMIADNQAAIDALLDLDFVDESHIYLGGYALGGNLSLLTAALDDRIAGVAVSSAFTPLRASGVDKPYEGIRMYAHLYGLIPNLGFFIDQEKRIPVDFPEILSTIAPKPLLVISPQLDRHGDLDEILRSISSANEIYGLYGNDRKIHHLTPKSYNHFNRDQEMQLVHWVSKLINR